MLEEVKEKLLEQPDCICNILSHFGFAHINIRGKEIRCGFDESTNPNSICLKLENNPDLFIKDFGRNMCYDLLNYIIRAKQEQFKTVISVIKDELGISNIYTYKKRKGLFDGIYDDICNHNSELNLQVLDESILNEYLCMGNSAWIKDGISLNTQKKFQIGYSIVDQRVTIPIRAYDGSLLGVKGRANYEVSENEPKYLYLWPTAMSQCLYGFYTNYNTLYESDVKIFESEKSVMVCDSFGVNDCVALGSNSLSFTQAKLLLSLNPKSITFLLDNSLSLDNTMRNIEVLKSFCKMRDLDVYYFDWTSSIALSDKESPVDQGKEVYENILKYDLVKYKRS